MTSIQYHDQLDYNNTSYRRVADLETQLMNTGVLLRAYPLPAPSQVTVGPQETLEHVYYII